MRVLLDANVILSYLVVDDKRDTTIGRLMNAAFAGRFVTVLPELVLREVSDVVAKEAYFQARVDPPQFEKFVGQLMGISEVVPQLDFEIDLVVRDPKDSFLLIAAHYAEVDVLVSGDKDLLALRNVVSRLLFRTPREFLELIEG
jgi:putative PIN family toxin of toxin-antitoxin system